MVPFTVIGAIAGTLATLLFVASALPMLIRAHRTRDLSSYSPANLIIANVGNLAQTIYVITLPLGPVWLMHAFNLVVSALMLLWWLRHHGCPERRDALRRTIRKSPHDHSDHWSDRNSRPLARR
ncbi:PQ-loop repeat-containing protein [Micropruina glycogenica]|uniref:Uncharacterized protein n=1 Tax=Micropruina glycogenica TaxID=75385 RepID=A0A2N9JI39_9ACTN|nr:hypothetical protein [Micropruina glycogenica]SPD87735.1 membrane protein of unknown function [Micropruina glycogenica]